MQRQTNDSHKHFIEAELATGKGKGKRYFLPNIPITPSDADCPIMIKRHNNRKNTVLCPFLTRDHALGVTVPLPYRYSPKGAPLPQRGSPFLKKGRCTKASFTNRPFTNRP